jgi:suppressor of ftsI/bilirubin oxidase
VQVLFENHLPQPSSLHWHGLPVNAASDGGGWQEVLPGHTAKIEFLVDLPAGLYWYHPHPHGLTAEQTYAGLAGLIVVREAVEDLRSAETVVTATVSDVRMDRMDRMDRMKGMHGVNVWGQGYLPYQPSTEDCLNGYLGNQVLLNGALPTLLSCREYLRLRLCNTSNARIFLLACQVDETFVPMQVLGTDLGYVDGHGDMRDPPQQAVFFAPGERLDLLLDLSAHVGKEWRLHSLPFAPREQHRTHVQTAHQSPWHTERHRRWPALAGGQRCGAEQLAAARLPQGAALSILSGRVIRTEFRTESRASSQTLKPTHSAPSTSPVSAVPAADLIRSPTSALAHLPVRRLALSLENGQWLIDGGNYATQMQQIRVRRNTREVWEIRSTPVGMPHPMHWHHFGVRVLSRRASYGPARELPRDEYGRLATDKGLKDTLLIWPGETVSVLLDFTLPDTPEFSGTQQFMWHCHNLEHEDGMMMVALLVE